MGFSSVRSAIQDLQDNYYDLIETRDFGILTWLSFGAIFQLLSLAYLPARVAASLPVLWLLYRMFKATIDTRGLFTTSFTDIKQRRWTPDIIDQIFKDMWREAENNRSNWTYLGRSATLCDTSDAAGTTTIWLSYWKDLKGLRAFANSAAHRLGQDRFNAKRFPYMGIMHETFHAPNGSWEAIYDSFRLWGIGTLKYAVGEGRDELEPRGALKVNPRGSSMFSRMGRRQ
ncbi:hypothetical protein CC80DRAFT_488794 [Byssothecium circinans]|uniref:Uncharacterized protein n=1 Tax=Byssothecium circinans TaxID=147558 RepID=A0A6A5U9E2_9PLEO|nr:hypothetical protein CC80DRAFT_488794 [Byssothecium circinans]